MLKPVEQTGYMQLNEKEIILIASNLTVVPTNYLAKEAKYASKDHKVLFVYEEPQSEFLNMQSYLDNENINIIYISNLIAEDMEHYISDNKPEYIYIDYFNSLNTQQDFINDTDKTIYLLDKLREYTEKYGVKFMISDRYNSKTDPKGIYLTDTYNHVNCVWVLKEDAMNRIK